MWQDIHFGEKKIEIIFWFYQWEMHPCTPCCPGYGTIKLWLPARHPLARTHLFLWQQFALTPPVWPTEASSLVSSVRLSQSQGTEKTKGSVFQRRWEWDDEAVNKNRTYVFSYESAEPKRGRVIILKLWRWKKKLICDMHFSCQGQGTHLVFICVSLSIVFGGFEVGFCT